MGSDIGFGTVGLFGWDYISVAALMVIDLLSLFRFPINQRTNGLVLELSKTKKKVLVC